MAEEVDAIGAEMATMTKTMLQLATLVALRTRERGQKEAEQRVKITQARIKEAKEMAARQIREAKARDPRNAELGKMMSKGGVQLGKQRNGSTLERDRKLERTEMQRFTARDEAVRIEADRAQAQQPAKGPEMPAYDSAERREALAMELAAHGVAPELIEVRMLAELAQGKPAIEATREIIDGPTPMNRARDRGRGLDRERERER